MVRTMFGLLRDVGSGGGQHRRTPAGRARARGIYLTGWVGGQGKVML